MEMNIPMGRAPNPMAVWRFSETDLASPTIADAVPGEPVPLTLTATSTVAKANGGLELLARSAADSAPTPHVNFDAKTGGGVSFEVWVTPATTTQGAGSYTVIAQSAVNINGRNLSIEQRGEAWAGRIRTSATTSNGDPIIAATPAVDTTKPTHLVLVASPAGRILYVDGVAFSSSPNGEGTLQNWDANYKIRIGDDAGADRHWQGTLWFAAMYDRALTVEEVGGNLAAHFDCTDC